MEIQKSNRLYSIMSWYYDQESNFQRRSAQSASGFTKSYYFCSGRAIGVGRHYADRAQRVDLLGYVWKKSGNKEYSYREGAF